MYPYRTTSVPFDRGFDSYKGTPDLRQPRWPRCSIKKVSSRVTTGKALSLWKGIPASCVDALDRDLVDNVTYPDVRGRPHDSDRVMKLVVRIVVVNETDMLNVIDRLSDEVGKGVEKLLWVDQPVTMGTKELPGPLSRSEPGARRGLECREMAFVSYAHREADGREPVNPRGRLEPPIPRPWSPPR
jgi:hypothetical protein